MSIRKARRAYPESIFKIEICEIPDNCCAVSETTLCVVWAAAGAPRRGSKREMQSRFEPARPGLPLFEIPPTVTPRLDHRASLEVVLRIHWIPRLNRGMTVLLVLSLSLIESLG